MPGLGLIKGISEEAAELLEAAGVEKPLDLATQEVDNLFPHLKTACRALKRPDSLPNRGQIQNWINAARSLVETISPGTLPGSAGGANLPSQTPTVSPAAVSTAATAATSTSAPSQLSPDNKAVAVTEPVVIDEDPAMLEDVPLVEIVDDADDEALPVEFEEAPSVQSHLRTVLPEVRTNDFSKDADTLAHLEKLRARTEVDMGIGSPKIQDEDDIWKDVDKSVFATFDDYQEGKMRVRPLERKNAGEDEAEASGRTVERIETAPEEDEQISRFIRRGVNYPYPVLAYVSALFVLFFRFYMVVMAVCLPITLIQLGDAFHDYWIPTAVVIGVFLILGVINLVILSKVRCRVCSCPMFLSQRCFKNKKAHLVNGLGYVASLALHIVLFQWFRCMYCGTAIRIRGAAKTKRMEVLDARALDVHDDDDDDPIKNF